MAAKRLTLNQVSALDENLIRRAGTEQLRSYVRTLADVANKRLKRLEQRGLSELSPAYRATGERPRFSTKGLTEGQLRQEFFRAKSFLEGDTSTITGTQKLRKKLADRVGRQFSPDEEKRFWKVIDLVRDSNNPFAGLADSPPTFGEWGESPIQQMVADNFDEYNVLLGDDFDAWEKAILEELREEYEQKASAQADLWERIERGEFIEF